MANSYLRTVRLNVRLGNLLVITTAAAIGAPSPQSLLDQALHFADFYNWYAARPLFEQARRLFEAAGDNRDALYARCGAIRAGAEPAPITELSYRLGRELTTNPLLESDKELRMFCLTIKGDFDGEIDSAAMRRDWEEVRSLADELGNAKWRYRAQAQLGFADYYDGDVSASQRNVAEALLAATQIKDVGAQIFILGAIADGQVNQGMADQGLDFADRAISLAAANPDAGYPFLAHTVRVFALLRKGQPETAKSELAEIMERPEVRTNEAEMAELTVTASEIARATGHIPNAIGYLNEALKHARANTYSKMLPEVQSQLSGLYRATGNLPKAEELARAAAASAQTAGYTPLVPPLLDGVAQIEISEHRYRDANSTYDRAAAIQDIMVGNANSAFGKTALITGATDLYAKHFVLLADHFNNPAKAFAVIEQARGRVMTDLLLSGAKTSPEAARTENEISRLRLKLTAAQSDRQIRELRDEIFIAEQRRWITPEVNILKTVAHNPVTLTAVEMDLSPAEAILEYVVDDPASYCMAITRDGVHLAKLKGRKALFEEADAFLREVKAKHRAQAEARRLYTDLIDAVPGIRDKERLIIVRDGPLHLVPFDALIDGGNHYLVESRIVTYAPSASSLLLLRSRRHRRASVQGVLAVGGVEYDRSGLKAANVVRGYSLDRLANLPNSEEEARMAAALLPNPANTLLLGDRATESAFKKAVNHRIIHLAVHAVTNEVNPERAAIILLSDPAKGDDGFLQASEIAQLPLDADLVVLSACDTGVGPVEGQEGIANLSKAFLLAGARTVISTLWSLDDDTALFLMKEFYAQLALGHDTADALAAAKRKILKTFGQV
jgi:CHAT domain-containing protein